MFTRVELESWLYAIERNNLDNVLGACCEIIIGRLDGFEQYVKDRRKDANGSEGRIQPGSEAG